MEPLNDFEIVRTGSQRGSALLIDSRSYKYTIKFKGKLSTRWTCCKRSKLFTCKATVIQTGSTFKPDTEAHTHPSLSELLTSSNVRVEIKEKATSHVFTSPQAITNGV
ncbi:hypothetical protein LOD99_7402 [Oopsacas minuta]|uniref:FLYWCH-type domain-containing protein n=1 Tax=Oopsacas minuta TaxID=111878 RepID=A0AAV7JUJ5_9METZ|nr:hypothetical protein LOD99_7402 [Oopsacas minuta]